MVNKVLHVFSSTHRGGAETMIMNLYRSIDRTKLQFDFISHSSERSDYDDEIERLGGRIYRINSLSKSGAISYIRNLVRIIKDNGPYVAVHSHTNIQGGIVALAAYLAGVKMRVCHSHNTRWDPQNLWIHRMFSYFLKQMIYTFASNYVACGIDAAESMFTKRRVANNQVKILKNSIDLKLFNENSKLDSKRFKKELGISENTFVIGHIGRFHSQKNHKFIISLAEYLISQKLDFKLLLIGNGELKEEIEEQIKFKNLSKHVMLLGVREDIPNLLHVFDVFLLPSLYEGLPVVLVEAQATGTPCIIADTITDEVDLGLGLVDKVNLNSSYKTWYEAIIKVRNKSLPPHNKIFKKIRKNGYDVNDNASIITDYYLKGSWVDLK